MLPADRSQVHTGWQHRNATETAESDGRESSSGGLPGGKGRYLHRCVGGERYWRVANAAPANGSLTVVTGGHKPESLTTFVTKKLRMTE